MKTQRILYKRVIIWKKLFFLIHCFNVLLIFISFCKIKANCLITLEIPARKIFLKKSFIIPLLLYVAHSYEPNFKLSLFFKSKFKTIQSKNYGYDLIVVTWWNGLFFLFFNHYLLLMNRFLSCSLACNLRTLSFTPPGQTRAWPPEIGQWITNNKLRIASAS